MHSPTAGSGQAQLSSWPAHPRRSPVRITWGSEIVCKTLLCPCYNLTDAFFFRSVCSWDCEDNASHSCCKVRWSRLAEQCHLQSSRAMPAGETLLLHHSLAFPAGSFPSWEIFFTFSLVGLRALPLKDSCVTWCLSCLLLPPMGRVFYGFFSVYVSQCKTQHKNC